MKTFLKLYSLPFHFWLTVCTKYISPKTKHIHPNFDGLIFSIGFVSVFGFLPLHFGLLFGVVGGLYMITAVISWATVYDSEIYEELKITNETPDDSKLSVYSIWLNEDMTKFKACEGTVKPKLDNGEDDPETIIKTMEMAAKSQTEAEERFRKLMFVLLS